MNICPSCQGETKTKFCNRSCSAKFNNTGRQRNRPAERTCKHCDSKFERTGNHSSYSFCPKCLAIKSSGTEKTCSKCKTVKPLSDFYKRKEGGPSSQCKTCVNNVSTEAITRMRQERKLILVTEFGNKCQDCGFTGPPFMFDFDHRNPEEKERLVGHFRSLEKMRKEAEKCDLVCANCHRLRTHKQRCLGCQYCYVNHAETTVFETALTP